MKKILLFLLFFLLSSNSAIASDNYIKVHYSPGFSLSGRTIDVVLDDTFRGSDDVIADVYKKLKEIKASGRLDYVVPDAASISIEVKYEDEIIKSTNSSKVKKLEEFLKYQELWEEAYSLVWEAIEENLKSNLPKPNDGFIPDEVTAAKVAEAILIPIYGEELINGEKPFTATLNDGVWKVMGTLHCPGGDDVICVGGVAIIEISRDDGKVLSVIHEQ